MEELLYEDIKFKNYYFSETLIFEKEHITYKIANLKVFQFIP